MNTTEEAIRNLCDELCETLTAKNSNYGDATGKPPYFVPWLEPLTAIFVRMSDKVSRLKTLITRESDKVGESVRDTLLDNAGYSLLAIIEWDKEHRNDTENNKKNQEEKL